MHNKQLVYSKKALFWLSWVVTSSAGLVEDLCVGFMSVITKGSPKVVLWRSLLFAPLAARVHTGCSAFPFLEVSGFTYFARDPKYSRFHEPFKNRIRFLNKPNFKFFSSLNMQTRFILFRFLKNARVKVNKTDSYRNKICYDSNTGYPVIATSADSDEMSHVAVFHLGLHCLIKAHLYGVIH